MRLIKLFEEFGDKLFSEISFNEMLDKFHGKTEDFTKDEVDWVVNYFNGWSIMGDYVGGETRKIDGVVEYNGLTVLSASNESLLKNYKSSVFSAIAIVKLVDEWYYVLDKNNRGYYKCDTFDGVKQCLDYIKVVTK